MLAVEENGETMRQDVERGVERDARARTRGCVRVWKEAHGARSPRSTFSNRTDDCEAELSFVIFLSPETSTA